MTASSHTLVIEPLALAGSRSLRDIFSHLNQSNMAVLFDSAGSNTDSRYSIVVWSPFVTVTTKDGVTTVVHARKGETETTVERPFSVIKRLHRQFFGEIKVAPEYQQLASELPFLIGVAGLAGYDTGRYYETLPSQAKDDYSCPDVAVGLYDQSLIEDNVTGKIYHCRFEHLSEFSDSQRTAKHTDRFELTSSWQSNLSKPAYLRALTKIDAYLKSGDCYQVNMAQRFSAQYKGDPFDAYCRLRDSNKAPFSAYIHCGKSHVLSISPERFISVNKHGLVQTKPIKGTRPRFDDSLEDAKSAEDLLSAEKDRAENLMIVDLLRNDISKHCVPHTVAVPTLFALESFPAVHHLVSTITAKLSSDASPLDLLAGAFPGGSITGAPKVRAMEIIDELEPNRRNVYCGSVFYLGAFNDLDSSICIRTLLAEDNEIHCWAGGGIVVDSDPMSEYQETLDKVAKILPELANTRE